MELKDLLATDGWIPSLPEGVVPILAELRRDEPDLRQVNHLLSRELGLMVRVLRLANSARYRPGSARIGSIEAATSMLGLKATQQLVQAAAMSAVFRQVQGVNMTEFWRYSLDVAKIARSLAEEVRQDEGLAFTAGLLHGTGDLILRMAMPDRACLQGGFTAESHARQLADLGYAYPEVGAAFASKWQFPETIVEAIRHQCDPRPGDGASEALVSVLFLACWSARAHELDIEGTALLDAPPTHVAESIGMSDVGRLRDEDIIPWTPIEEAREFS